MNNYYQSLRNMNRNLPLQLSNEEQTKLLNKMNDNLNVKNEIIKHNLRLVIAIIVKCFLSSDMEFDEMFSFGCEGLIKAVYSYDIKKNIRFSSYASICIINRIKMELRKKRTKKYQLLKPISLDLPIHTDEKGEELSLKDIIEAQLSNPLEQIVEKEARKDILQVVSTLPLQEQQIVTYSYGLNNSPIYNQKEISNIVGVTQSAIAKRLKRSLKKIENKYRELI